MVTISLKGAEFFAFHGYHPEEQQLGTTFIVDLDVSFQPADALEKDNIGNTVDYQQLYTIIAAQMTQTRQLIETVAQGIADQVKQSFPFAAGVRILIKKLNPPLKGVVAYSAVELIV